MKIAVTISEILLAEFSMFKKKKELLLMSKQKHVKKEHAVKYLQE